MSDAVPPRNPVGWFEIYVEDLARATAFYEAVFRVDIDPLDAPADGPPVQMRAFPMTKDGGGAAGALVKMDGFAPAVGGTLVYFSCRDCAVEAGRAASAGGRVQREKTAIGQYGFMALVQDTEGNLIGLHSME